jgi:hypothetical protein
MTQVGVYMGGGKSTNHDNILKQSIYVPAANVGYSSPSIVSARFNSTSIPANIPLVNSDLNSTTKPRDTAGEQARIQIMR